MKKEEEEAFEEKFGYKPTRISVALDCLAVYVHKDNPVTGLSLDQVDGIFSKTRKTGRREHRHLGRPGPDRETGLAADQPLRPQLGQRHLCLLQGTRAGQGRLQGRSEGAAGIGGGRPRRGQRPGGNRLFRDRLPDLGSARDPLASKAADSAPVEPTFDNALTGKYPWAVPCTST